MSPRCGLRAAGRDSPARPTLASCL
jgi:hypothetical protein